MNCKNKKPKIIVTLLLGFFLFLTLASADVSVLLSNEKGLSLAYRPSLSQTRSIDANKKTYTLFFFDNHSMTASAGEPMLPEMAVHFAAPAGITPAVDASGINWSEKTGVLIAPMPVLEDDKQGFAIEVYKENPLYYAMSGYRPNSFWNIEEGSTENGVTFWELTLRPVLFDAHASKAAVADSFDINISFGAVPAGKRALFRRLPKHIINRELYTSQSGLPYPQKAADTVFNPFAAGDWYRVKVDRTGIYRISGSELSQAGFTAGSIESDHIRMYYGGGKTLTENPKEIIPDGFSEIAIRVDDGGDGVFDIGDTILFYGSALSRFVSGPGNDRPEYQNHPYSTENVYWITISDEGSPERIQPSGETPLENSETRTTFSEILHTEPENYPDFEETGINWYWEEISGSSKSFAFSAPGTASADSALFSVKFLNEAITYGHNVDIYINNTGPYSFILLYSKHSKVSFIHHGKLEPSGNIIKIVRTNGDLSNVIRLDWMEVEYSRFLEQFDDTVEFYIRGDDSPQKLSIAGVKKSSSVIFDTTDPFRVTEISRSSYDSEAQTLTFQVTVPTGTRSRFIVSDPSSYMNVTSITKKKTLRPILRTIGNGADYIIITHPMFLDDARRLASWRARDSKKDPLTTMVVDVNDIYDEFAWGVFDPVAIRDFLKYAWDNYGTAVRYCCFFGDTIWKYKNLTESQKGRVLVPTMYHIGDRGCTATDDFYTWFDSTTMPYIAVGRLCAYDDESAGILVDKIIDYERTPENGIWHNRILFVADDEWEDSGRGSETAFSIDTDNLESKGYVLNSLERTKLMMIEYPLKNFRKPDATEDFINEFNDGYLLMNFIGHGNTELIAHEHILEGSRDIERLNNGRRQTVFFISSCSTSQFDRIDNISLSEMLHNRNGGGCLAIIGAARKTWNAPNYNLNKTYYINLFDRAKNPEHRIGYAMLAGKIQSYDDGNANRYIILGDPATRLMLPRLTFAVADIDTVFRLQKLNLSGEVTDHSGTIPYAGTLHIKAHGPKIHLTYTTMGGKKIPYSQPGRTFYNGYITITGNGFNSTVVAPKDLVPTGDDSKIYFFATGDTEEAAGCIENFIIGGLDPQAPEDITSPEIKLSFDGKSFEDGDYIRRQPTMSATFIDSSGVNTYGNRGHNITLMIDNDEMVVLTDRLLYNNGFTTGNLEYTFPILATGEHAFEISAYDSYNNIAKKRVSATVIGSETGDISIENLLNYPNPMESDGTTFTFNLNDDAGKAKIKLYSQSGRLVDSISFSASYGYNTVYWKPSFVPANGVYFYKLTVWSFNGRTSSKIEKLVVMR